MSIYAYAPASSVVVAEGGPVAIGVDQLSQLTADLEAMTTRAKTAERERDAALKDAAEWKHECEMYARVWLREMGGTLFNKRHRIDAYAMTTAYHYQRSERDLPRIETAIKKLIDEPVTLAGSPDVVSACADLWSLIQSDLRRLLSAPAPTGGGSE